MQQDGIINMEPTTVTTPENPTVTVTVPNSIDQITAAVTDVNKEAPAVESLVTQAEGIKEGYKTSEFWVVLGTDITAVLGGIVPANSIWIKAVSLGVLVISSLAYLWARVSLKLNT